MGCAEGRSPLAGSLRACPEPAEGVSLKYNIFSLPGLVGEKRDGRKGFSSAS